MSAASSRYVYIYIYIYIYISMYIDVHSEQSLLHVSAEHA